MQVGMNSTWKFNSPAPITLVGATFRRYLVLEMESKTPRWKTYPPPSQILMTCMLRVTLALMGKRIYWALLKLESLMRGFPETHAKTCAFDQNMRRKSQTHIAFRCSDTRHRVSNHANIYNHPGVWAKFLF